MPELPEVEIARRNLTHWLGRSTITDASAARSRILTGSPSTFGRLLRGRSVRAITRRGKWLRIELDGGWRLFSHLGMTGKWVRRDPQQPALRWERARLDGARRGAASSVRYVDPRLFGKLTLVREDIAAWSALGVDPLVDGIDLRGLATALAGRRRVVKDVLMDQTVIAGLGNIQVTEALWLAGIDPRSPAAALSAKDVSGIAKAIATTIRRTLADEDGPEIQYVHEAGASNPFWVYGKSGALCPRCPTPLSRVVLGGRGTTFCGGCQVRRS